MPLLVGPEWKMIFLVKALASGYLVWIEKFGMKKENFQLVLCIPISREPQVRYLFQIVKTFQVGKDLFGMPNKVREQSVNMTGSRDNVTQCDVQIDRQFVCFHTRPPETQVCLVVDVI